MACGYNSRMPVRHDEYFSIFADTAHDIARQLTINPQAFEHATYETALGEGLTGAKYVKVIGLASRTIGGNFTKDERIANGLGPPMKALEFLETVEIMEEL